MTKKVEGNGKPTTSFDEALAVLEQLKVADLRARLDELEAERKRLMPLLRIARRRERQDIERKGAPDAAG